MDRKSIILRGISKSHRGIEVAPWFAPIAPKREGYQCLSLDVFDTATLRTRGAANPEIGEGRVHEIEDVDLVGSATEIASLVTAKREAGTFDYVVSSHNFEHLPNPIRFLQGCQTVLKRGGVLSMALPDRRACFDYFRPVTTTAEWIEAFTQDRRAPTPAGRRTGRACRGARRPCRTSSSAIPRDCARCC